VITRAQLLAASRDELRALLERGHPIDLARLDDTVYRGISLGLPAWVERLSWKKFAKAFHRDPATSALRGWNVRIEQDGLDRPWRARTRRGRTWTFGHFAVVRDGERTVLDYGVIRDPLVALEAASVELLLGRSDLVVGPMRVATPSYFVLEREGPLAPADVA
jgi:hypothetical protein